MKAAKKWIAEKVGEENAGEVLSSWARTPTIGQVYRRTTAMPAVSTKALDSTNRGKLVM